MKEKHKNLLLASLISAILMIIVAGYNYISTLPVGDNTGLPPPESFLDEGIVGYGWMVYPTILIVCFVVLTVILYFLIGYLMKKKK